MPNLRPRGDSCEPPRWFPRFIAVRRRIRLHRSINVPTQSCGTWITKSVLSQVLVIPSDTVSPGGFYAESVVQHRPGLAGAADLPWVSNKLAREPCKAFCRTPNPKHSAHGSRRRIYCAVTGTRLGTILSDGAAPGFCGTFCTTLSGLMAPLLPLPRVARLRRSTLVCAA